MSKPSAKLSLANPCLWEHRRTHYFAVFERALMLLRNKAILPEDEPNLTRELSFTVVTARRELDPHGRFERPRFEAQNLPDPDDEFVQPHEHKRPDIQWIHDDDTSSDDRHREKSFVIECKRLGEPTKSNWKLNQEYVINGISRFHSENWRYGNHMAEGAMIAFVQTMDFQSIQNEINGHTRIAEIPEMKLDSSGIKERGVTRFSHEFCRSFPNSPFRLVHLWLDIRDVPRCQRPAQRQSKLRPKASGITKKGATEKE